MRLEWSAERFRATRGTYLYLPPGVPHSIRHTSDKIARVVVACWAAADPATITECELATAQIR
ncbi:cupin domain-containing protein [Bradyrhizobium canariense]|uniref:cupin domain-containing protein n=1 Tax=Bradyrhizobium TaxID=374 RepID=UPI001177992C